ncbi:MAG TPA: hypothetical protein VG734_25510 [Lacunisphaera sp.]|jgi:hypothetical protein|nr:hypothetical protein [Lacunisphaera sp.]
MIDATSAWLGALFAIASVLALVVFGFGFLVYACRGYIAVFLRSFRTLKLDRLQGQVQVTTSFVERRGDIQHARVIELPAHTPEAAE